MKEKKYFFTFPGYEFCPFDSKQIAEIERTNEIMKRYGYNEMKLNDISEIYSVYIDMNL
jgi:hypothetical protein